MIRFRPHVGPVAVDGVWRDAPLTVHLRAAELLGELDQSAAILEAEVARQIVEGEARLVPVCRTAHDGTFVFTAYQSLRDP